MKKITIVFALLIIGFLVSAQKKSEVKDFVPIDGEELLNNLNKMEVGSYKMKNNELKHYGPLVKEFYKYISPGVEAPDSIIASDMAGVTLCAVKAIIELTTELKQNQKMLEETTHRLNEEVEKTIKASDELNELNNKVTDLESRLLEFKYKLEEIQAAQKE